MTIKLHFSEKLVRRAVVAFWFRVTGWRFFAALLILALSLGWFVATGVRSWMIAVEGAGLFLGIAFSCILYFSHMKASLGRFRRMRVPEATIELGESEFRATSDAGTFQFPWRNLKKIWCFEDFWLFFPSHSQFLTFPLADLNAEARAFIRERAQANAVKIS